MTDEKFQFETTERELVFTRQFDAPRELVFAAYSSCEHLRNWWGPRTWPMVDCTLDFRVGGIWHYCMRGPNEGDESWGRAVYEVIVEPERIVYNDAFSDSEGNINRELPRTRATLEFNPRDGKTVLTGRAEYPSAAELKQVLEMGMVEGMSETMDRLEEHLEQISPAKR